MLRLASTILLVLAISGPTLAQTCEPFEVLSAGSFPQNGYEPEPHCNFDNSCPDRDRAFRYQKTFDEFWIDLHDHFITNPPPPPTIDFDEYIVVAVTLGQRPTTGFGIGISCISYEEDPPSAPNADVLVRVEALEQIAGSNCNVIHAITKPYVIVKVSRDDVERLTLAFDHSTTVNNCSTECSEPCCTGCTPEIDECPPVCPGSGGSGPIG